MLADFQQALADLTASPELCVRVRCDPGVLRERYQLTEKEWSRLVGIVKHRGMECNCMLYRANRLAPLAMNVPGTCKALGKNLREIVSEFWSQYPETNVHFFIETDRFCQFLKAKLAKNPSLGTDLASVLDRESAIIKSALAQSYIEGNCQD